MDALWGAALALALPVEAFLAVLARFSLIIFLLPGIGEQMVPIRARATLLVGLSLAVTALAPPDVPRGLGLAPLTGLLLSELTAGFFLGASLRVMIWMLTAAGSLIAQSVGLSQLMGVSLDTEAQTITANLLSLTGAALLVTLDIHVEVIASALRYYEEVPPGQLGRLDPGAFIGAAVSAVGHAFLLAWPFVVVSLLYNLILGFVNRALPQLMVAFVGAPIVVGAGLFMLLATLGGLFLAWLGKVPLLVFWL